MLYEVITNVLDILLFSYNFWSPVVLVPGIQARWEWMRPAVRALAELNQTITTLQRRLQRETEDAELAVVV